MKAITPMLGLICYLALSLGTVSAQPLGQDFRPILVKKGVTRAPLTRTQPKVNARTLQGYKQQLANAQERQNHGREMLTTRLQAEIQARSQDITLATHMIKEANKKSREIANNIGR